MAGEGRTRRQRQLDRQFVREVEDIFARRRETSFENLVKAFEAVETKYVELETEPFSVLETRRRVAEMRLRAATTTCCPLETCRAELDNLFRLGFTNLQMKVTMCTFFARYCQETGLAQQGIDVLEPVEAEIQAELKRAGMKRREREFYQDLLGSTQVLLSKLRASLDQQKAE